MESANRSVRSVTSKFKSKFLENKEGIDAALDVLKITFESAKEGAEATGVPGLAVVLSSGAKICDVLRKMRQNKEDIEALSNRVERLCGVLTSIPKEMLSESSALRQRLERLSKSLETTGEEVVQRGKASGFKRAVKYEVDVQWVKGKIQEISWAIESFLTDTTMHIEFMLDENARFVETEFTVVKSKLDETRNAIKDFAQQQVVHAGRPPHALRAAFDHMIHQGRLVECATGTRAAVLGEIKAWIDMHTRSIMAAPQPNRQSSTPASRILWINGEAGTGKSTIAYTVAKHCRESNLLGASFFCTREDGTCSDLGLVFPTMSYQLGLFHPPFGEVVTQVLNSNPGTAYTRPLFQLEDLIVKPLQSKSVRNSFPPCVVILDALDECKDTGSRSTILSALAGHIHNLAPIIFIITSRPEHSIELGFDIPDLVPCTHRLRLRAAVAETVLLEDIKHYLKFELAEIKIYFRIVNLWPPEMDVQILAQLSSGLFIFAATSVKFIGDKAHWNPVKQLQRLIDQTAPSLEESSPLHQLDMLYGQILNLAFPQLSIEALRYLKMVVGSIVMVKKPLSPVELEKLLRLPDGRLRQILLHLHSLIVVPDNDTDVIRLLHPSFFDFITSDTRCLPKQFLVKPAEQHILLAMCCLQAMKSLPRDICQIRNPSLLNTEIDDLSARIDAHIPQYLQYACRYWEQHISQGKSIVSDALLELLDEFCSNDLLHWIEVCSLLGELRQALISITAMVSLYQKFTAAKRPTATPITFGLLCDCERFIHQFFPVISDSALHVYHSALWLTPRNTLIWKHYDKEMPLPFKVYNAFESMWTRSIMIMEASEQVDAALFSPNGAFIISGSQGNRSLQLWDVIGGLHLKTLQMPSPAGPKKSYVSGTPMAFSPDSTQVLFSSGGQTYSWDFTTGECQIVFSEPQSAVTAITFSPDGTSVICGYADNRLCKWDATTGGHLCTFDGHTGEITSVVFSQDGSYIVSASRDKTVRLWDSRNPVTLKTFKGHKGVVHSVALHPDAAQLASTSDKTVKLWNTASGSLVRTFKGHLQNVTTVEFSPDGQSIVSACDDHTIKIWDTQSGAPILLLEGHSAGTTSASFNLDGTRILSSSIDHSVRLWDVVGLQNRSDISKHTNSVSIIQFSSDGKYIMSMDHRNRKDTSVRVWDAKTGSCISLMAMLKSPFRALISPDGTVVASISEKLAGVQLNDAASGRLLTILQGGHSFCHCIAFSMDGRSLVAGITDGRILLWDVDTGNHRTFKVPEGMSMAYDIAFSEDGTRIMTAVRGHKVNTRTINMWDVSSGNLLETRLIEPGMVLSTDGSLVPVIIKPYVMTEGWIYSTAQNRRICWIPVDCRPSGNSLDVFNDRVAIGTEDGRVILFDFTDIDSYYKSLE